ncbi:MAG: hypothetical protein OK422_03225 [Thaumarchaeota archaeon]|nr:hypothetical protein [Nitrososphaerota archaeon]
MSLPTARQAFAFLRPLKTKSTVLVVGSRAVNIELARFLLGCLEVMKLRPLVLDSDALYSSEATQIGSDASDQFASRATLSVPLPEQRIDYWLTRSLVHGATSDAILIDNLNTVFHSLNSTESKSAMKKLTFISALLSMIARTRPQSIFATLYARDPSIKEQIGKRTFRKLGDQTVSVRLSDHTLSFECTRGTAWSGEAFSVSLNP